MRLLPRPVHPLLDPAHLGPPADGRRDPPDRGQGLARGQILDEPLRSRPAVTAQRPLGPVLGGVSGDRDGRVRAHRVGRYRCGHRTRRPDERRDHLRGHQDLPDGDRSRVVTDLPEVQESEGGIVGGRHRLDPVLPRSGGLHLQAAQGMDPPQPRRPATERSLPRPRRHLLHRRRLRPGQPRPDERGHDHLGMRLPPLRQHLAALPRGGGGGCGRADRHAGRQSHPPECHAGVLVRPVRPPAARAVHDWRVAAGSCRPRHLDPLPRHSELEGGHSGAVRPLAPADQHGVSAAPLAGVRVLEVASHVFVPLSGAVLAEWGTLDTPVSHRRPWRPTPASSTSTPAAATPRHAKFEGEWAPSRNGHSLSLATAPVQFDQQPSQPAGPHPRARRTHRDRAPRTRPHLGRNRRTQSQQGHPVNGRGSHI
ncbi:hypothetical protein FRAHR75_640035 [Frankia sp. Hr75.2]|nr:hypothetical protein FRAHR75_640035 [Frankia sp. Hr75.2]